MYLMLDDSLSRTSVQSIQAKQQQGVIYHFDAQDNDYLCSLHHCVLGDMSLQDQPNGTTLLVMILWALRTVRLQVSLLKNEVLFEGILRKSQLTGLGCLRKRRFVKSLSIQSCINEIRASKSPQGTSPPAPTSTMHLIQKARTITGIRLHSGSAPRGRPTSSTTRVSRCLLSSGDP